MFAFLIKLAIMIALAYVLRPKPPKPPRSAGLEEFQIPTAEEGRSIQVIFGKRREKGPNVVWYGDLKANAIKEGGSSGFCGMGRTKAQVVGYVYFLGVHFICGYANADGIKQIWVGEKCVWPSSDKPNIEAADASANDETKFINALNIFGGTDIGKEGGIKGFVDIQYGAANQGRNSYLKKRLGTNISAYRGLLSVILKQVYIGTSAYLKPWSFLIKRTNKLVNGTAQWYTIGNKHIIRPGELTGDDLNAIHIIRECLIDKEWGLGFSEGDINDENFKACADKLKEEGYGLSIIWDDGSAMDDFIDKILQIIAGSLYQNLSTGKWEIGLTRDDYDIENLESFNEDQIIEMEDFSKPGLGEVVDQITINWYDKIWDKNRSITLPDPAMIIKQGGKVIDTTFNYYSICNKELANKVAARELQLATSMLVSMRIKANRQMAHLKPNDVFKLSWSNLGIVNMIVRVLEVNYGHLTKNEIILNCCEDVFGTACTVIEDPPDTQWTDPVHDPVNTTHRFLMEVPYWHLCNYGLGQDVVNIMDDNIALMFALAAKPETTPDSYEFDLLVKLSPSYDFNNEGNGCFTSTAVLKNNLERLNLESNWIELENVQDLDLVSEDTYAIIEHPTNDEESEIVLILAVDNTEDAEKIKIARGILDTRPAVHSAGDRIWFVNFVDHATPVISKDYTQGDSPRVKFLTKTGKGILLEGDATEENSNPTYLSFNSRMIRPYLPGNFKIDDRSIKTLFFHDDLNLTWNHRDRTHRDQIRTLVKHTYAGDYGQEAGATYTLQIWNEAGIVMGREETGLTGKSYTYTEAMEINDFGSTQDKLRVKLWTVRDTYTSWQIYDLIIKRLNIKGSSAGQSGVSGTLKVADEWLKGNLAAQSGASGTLTVA